MVFRTPVGGSAAVLHRLINSIVQKHIDSVGQLLQYATYTREGVIKLDNSGIELFLFDLDYIVFGRQRLEIDDRLLVTTLDRGTVVVWGRWNKYIENNILGNIVGTFNGSIGNSFSSIDLDIKWTLPCDLEFIIETNNLDTSFRVRSEIIRDRELGSGINNSHPVIIPNLSVLTDIDQSNTTVLWINKLGENRIGIACADPTPAATTVTVNRVM